LPENLYEKLINKMPEFCMILARKIIKIPIFNDIAREINKIPEFYTILPEKCQNFT